MKPDTWQPTTTAADRNNGGSALPVLRMLVEQLTEEAGILLELKLVFTIFLSQEIQLPLLKLSDLDVYKIK